MLGQVKRFLPLSRLTRLMISRLTLSKVLHTAAVGAVVSVLASAQTPLPEVAQFGPQVGDVVPDFSLVDQFDERHDLQSAMGPNGLLLAFNRSANW